MLVLKNGETYTGRFKGMDDENILIGDFADKNILGLELNWVGLYFEESVIK